MIFNFIFVNIYDCTVTLGTETASIARKVLMTLQFRQHRVAVPNDILDSDNVNSHCK
jgi:hypothetical protein